MDSDFPPRSEKAGWADFFDDHAPDYERNVFTANTLAEVDFIVRELALASGARILDVGCGTGRHAIELARRGMRVVGVDISSGMLQEARRRAAAAEVEVEWIHSDAREFELESPVDAVICLCEGAFGLLGSADDPIAQPLAILRRVAAALKPGARCLFTVLNGYALSRRHSQASIEEGGFDPLALAEISEVQPPGAQPGTPLRERAFVPTELRLLFEIAGLEVTHIWGGTAGNWGRRAIDLDEIELMVMGKRPSAPAPRPG